MPRNLPTISAPTAPLALTETQLRAIANLQNWTTDEGVALGLMCAHAISELRNNATENSVATFLRAHQSGNGANTSEPYDDAA